MHPRAIPGSVEAPVTPHSLGTLQSQQAATTVTPEISRLAPMLRKSARNKKHRSFEVDTQIDPGTYTLRKSLLVLYHLYICAPDSLSYPESAASDGNPLTVS